ncbi:hypothetical protein [Pectobacterium punjabense]|uniref:hypothetical protein n=1 Tax=Pectobacterium punjabense TaxID=2108399 RepID=UPI0024071BCF|nr:hypothetical protein [Pectobacterium punjabense]MDG0799293.1 hypothetical protein [Pectobacterium punjabense]
MKPIEDNIIHLLTENIEKENRTKLNNDAINGSLDKDEIKNYILSVVGEGHDYIFFCGSYSKGNPGFFSDIDVFIINDSEEIFFYRDFFIFKGVFFEINSVTTSYLERRIPKSIKNVISNEFRNKTVVLNKGNHRIERLMKCFYSDDEDLLLEREINRAKFSLLQTLMDLCNENESDSFIITINQAYQKAMSILALSITKRTSVNIRYMMGDFCHENLNVIRSLNLAYRAAIEKLDPNIIIYYLIHSEFQYINWRYDFREIICAK